MNTITAVLAIAGALFFAVPVLAQWDVESINRTITETNFVVDKNCSGTLISVSERLILTNFHCIAGKIESVSREVVGADGVVMKHQFRRYVDVPVEQHGYDGYIRVRTTSYTGEIVAHDKKRDLALLKVRGTIPNSFASPMLPVGGTIARGERVYIVGNPAGQESTLVEGIVSNVNRTFEFSWTGSEKLAMIQFSGGLTGGNSGGALYNGSGQLIGVPAAVLNAADFLGLAVPITVVQFFMTENCMALVFNANADDAACLEKKKAAEAKRQPSRE